jgi:hypothetical protein
MPSAIEIDSRPHEDNVVSLIVAVPLLLLLGSVHKNWLKNAQHFDAQTE